MPSVGAVTANLTATVQAGTYTAKPGDLVIANATSAAFTVTLPANPATNTQVAVKKFDASGNVVTVTGGPGITVNGTATYPLAAGGATATFEFDGANWLLLATASSTVGLLPAGGTAGQILGKTSNADYATAWYNATTLAGNTYGPIYRSGYYYDNRITALAAAGTVSLAVGTQVYVPFWVPAAAAITAISAHVATGNASGTLNLGVYTALANGMPGSLLLPYVSASATASGVTALAYATTLPQGWNWFVIGSSGSTAVTLSALPLGATDTPLGMAAAPAAGAGVITYLSLASSGIPPATASSTLTSVQAAPPWIIVRAA